MTYRPKLEALPIFQGVGNEALDEIEKIGQITRLPKGARLVAQGDAPGKTQSLFLILEGHLRVSLTLDPESGIEKVIARFGPGEQIGEIAFLDRQARVATVTAEEDAVVFVLPRSAFEAFANHHSRAAYLILLRIARSLAERLRRTNEEFADALRAGLDSIARGG